MLFFTAIMFFITASIQMGSTNEFGGGVITIVSSHEDSSRARTPGLKKRRGSRGRGSGGRSWKRRVAKQGVCRFFIHIHSI